MNKKAKGDFYENAATQFLINNGIRIKENNYRCRLGEIDIIGIDKDTLVFFEVKYRKNETYGSALDAVDYKKQRRIIGAAQYYLAFKHYDCFFRFDVIGINDKEIAWIKNAFFVS